ncbi:Indole-diterpene biosynthesis protein [Coniochaeta hoffmannii]|uniref:Indole-diterpene biosynthesis protein n=1 Tax=Coniochaeta hoffmannii TaxID=91930 RepID=A0AA38RC84_9PEZI|nr:Indole-diterpene biosynthesis protein [Coniochaeta hoffmannii]
MAFQRDTFIPGFRSLGPTIFVQDSQPPSSQHRLSQLSVTTAATRSPSSPDLILITSWSGAVPKHIAKYTRSYNALYPHTPIMVITTHISDLAVRSTKRKTAVLAPAVEYLRQLDSTTSSSSSSSNTRILLHAFSDGGSNKAVCLAEAYLASTGGRRLPVAASVLDSTPGTARYSSNLAAFRRSLPSNAVIRTVGVPVGAFLIGVHWALFSLFVEREGNVFSKTRRGLNDERLWNLGGVPRTYVFSQADDLISWRDIEGHASEAAEKLGTTCMLVRFKESGHCCHAKEDQEYYWTAVRRTWEARDLKACSIE